MPNSNGTWTYTALYRFTGASDGADPYAGLRLTRPAIFMAPPRLGEISSASTAAAGLVSLAIIFSVRVDSPMRGLHFLFDAREHRSVGFRRFAFMRTWTMSRIKSGCRSSSNRVPSIRTKSVSSTKLYFGVLAPCLCRQRKVEDQDSGNKISRESPAVAVF